ncbi:methyltransferase [aff. Roholtiella sp. LEGE 12411]|uniref:methyltransferase n=1 Tax=aff. Roholtiella sp. LEGE 12411 TaxID=1828822 RepID=UPI00187FFF04|nr:methyltransferase [aff. Roholtiella sp. LEGE 12411]MBE9035178.1 methyltransferase [aff. Roholtiella sp. LEGE 12411]
MLQIQNQTISEQESTPVVLRQLITGYFASQSIYVAAKLGIADLLKDGAKNCDELAQSTGAHPRSLYRLMRVLVSVGIFNEIADNQFTLTAMGELLRSDAPSSLRTAAILFGEEPYRACADLHYSVMTGKTAFDNMYKMGHFEYLSQNPEAGETFNQAMTQLTTQVHTAVVHAYDFSGINRIVDVGGGHGLLIASILKANPHMTGILFELPFAIEGAQRLLEAEGVAERCEVVTGNFFESEVPKGGDAYLLKSVIHDWDDERSRTILKNCHQAIAKNGKLLLIERVLPDGNKPSVAKINDLVMLVVAGGCERTALEYQQLFNASGFQLTNIIPTSSGFSVIEGLPV